MPTYADIQGARAFGRQADAQPDRVTMRLLIIEDDRDAADYLVKAFREVGHVADAATDGDDGLAMALDGQYDVLVVDRMLPFLVTPNLLGVWCPDGRNLRLVCFDPDQLKAFDVAEVAGWRRRGRSSEP